MSEVNITINNREHKIACSPGEEERVKELAILLNNEVIDIANSLGQIGDVKLMVLAAITILDKNQDVIEDAIKIVDNSTKKLEKIYNKIEKKT
jgi:cell division protein ZapA